MSFPHVDKILDLRVDTYVVGVRHITGDEEVFRDHFPDNPIYPGTLIVESLAQLAGFLFEYSVNRDPNNIRRAVLVQIEDAKFHKPAKPGDTLELRCDFLSALEDAAQIKCVVTVNQEKIARATLTFVLRAVNSTKLHQHRQELYRKWTEGLELTHCIL